MRVVSDAPGAVEECVLAALTDPFRRVRYQSLADVISIVFLSVVNWIAFV